MIEHPSEGLLYPEDLPSKQVLKTVKPYVGKFFKDLVPFDPPAELQFTQMVESIITEPKPW